MNGNDRCSSGTITRTPVELAPMSCDCIKLINDADNLEGSAVDTEEFCEGSSDLLDGGWVVEVERKGARKSLWFKSAVNTVKAATCGKETWKELIAQLKLFVPIAITWLFQNLLTFVSLIFVGHISGRAFELDSVALATSLINVTGLSVGIGLSSAADTLCSQTYGFKNYKRVGHILQQGILILFVLCLFVWGMWLNTDNLLLILQQPPCISRFAGYYTKIFAFCLPPFYVYVMIQKYLQSQSRVWPFIIVGGLANILNVILHAILLLVLDLGIVGAAISMVICNIFQPAFLIVYIKVLKLHKLTWGGWSWESLRDWWQFLKLGLPGMAMICLEWVSYEIVVFVLGSIGEVELAINSILVNLLVLMFMVPLGISIASSIRVGNALGAGDPKGAKRTAYISMFLVGITAVLQLTFLQLIKNVMGSMYTEEQAVLDKLPFVVNIITPGLFFDQLQLVIQGVLRGCGLQTLGAVINFFAFYCFGLPLGISLAFKANMGVVGVWIGLMCATTSQCVTYLIIVLRMNWVKQAEKAQERASHGTDNGVEKGEEIDKEVHVLSLSAIKDETEGESFLDTLEKETILDADQCEVESEEPLLEENQGQLINGKMLHSHSILHSRSHIRLLLTKGSLFVLGASFVVIAGMASLFQVPDSILNGNFSECTNEHFYDEDDIVSSSFVGFPSPTPFIEWST